MQHGIKRLSEKAFAQKKVAAKIETAPTATIFTRLAATEDPVLLPGVVVMLVPLFTVPLATVPFVVTLPEVPLVLVELLPIEGSTQV